MQTEKFKKVYLPTLPATANLLATDLNLQQKSSRNTKDDNGAVLKIGVWTEEPGAAARQAIDVAHQEVTARGIVGTSSIVELPQSINGKLSAPLDALSPLVAVIQKLDLFMDISEKLAGVSASTAMMIFFSKSELS